MAGLIKPLNSVYDQFRRLPGVGNKSALRLAYHIIDMPEEEVRRLAETLLQAKREIRFCKECFNLTDGDICEICADTDCVVEQPQDAMAMERSHGYTGVYHVLHGCLSPLDGIGPENLRIKELLFQQCGRRSNRVLSGAVAAASARDGQPNCPGTAHGWRPGICRRGHTGQSAGKPYPDQRIREIQFVLGNDSFMSMNCQACWSRGLARKKRRQSWKL